MKRRPLGMPVSDLLSAASFLMLIVVVIRSLLLLLIVSVVTVSGALESQAGRPAPAAPNTPAPRRTLRYR